MYYQNQSIELSLLLNHRAVLNKSVLKVTLPHKGVKFSFCFKSLQKLRVFFETRCPHIMYLLYILTAERDYHSED